MMFTPPPRLRVGVIGVGRVGAVLGSALQSAGHPVVAVHAVSEKSRARALSHFPATDIVEIPEVIAASDAVLFAVPDDVLPQLIQGIAATTGFRDQQFIIHTSGVHGLSVLSPAAQQGAITMALHPAMTFTGDDSDRARLVAAPFAVTALGAAQAAAEALVIEMGGEPRRLDDADRVQYHAALSHASNHLNTLVGEVIDLLTAAGIDRSELFAAPLMQASLDNAIRSGIHALTGPVSRGDVETVRQHVAQLPFGNTRNAYLALARDTVARCLAAQRIDAETAQQLLDVLT